MTFAHGSLTVFFRTPALRGALTVFAIATVSACFPTLPPEEADGVTDTTPPNDVDENKDQTELSDTSEVDTGPGLNACGGTAPITMDAPGNSCGECNDGLVICDPNDPDKVRTRCVDATTRNTCGGCGVLEPSIGSDCGTCGTVACAEAGGSGTRCVEPALGCDSKLTCDDLSCGDQGRTCEPGLDEEDAACGDCAEGFTEFGEVCLVSLAPPTDVTASTDLEDRVVVTWAAISGAAGYKVYRCPLTSNCSVASSWTRLSGDSAITETLFADATGGAGGNLVASANVAATTTDTRHVTLTWDAVEPSAAPVFRYAVTTMSPAGESSRSTPALGSRAVPAVSTYEVSIDGGAFTEIGDALTWNDTEAPAGMVTPGVVAATDGLYADRVEVSVSGVRADAGAERRYVVRAVNARGPGAASVEVIGRRAVGAATITWERSTGPTTGEFAVVPGITLTAWTDTDAPQSGEVRWYRAIAVAEGALAATSEVVRGSRQGPPTPPQTVVATEDRDDGVRVTWEAVPGALGYHVYRDGLKLTTGSTGITVTQYDDRDDETLPTEWWAPPSDVAASSDDPNRVTLTWAAPLRPASEDFIYTVTAVNAAGEGASSNDAAGRRLAPAATGFQVSVDNGIYISAGDASATSWQDSNAPAPTLTPGTVAASDATDPAKVVLTSSGAGTTPGTIRSYVVRVMTASGAAGDPAIAATGRRVAGTLQRQWQRSSGASADGFSNLTSATGTTHDDTTAPSTGEVRFYRLEVSAAGAATVHTEADAGSRLPPAGVPGNVQASTDRTDGVRVTWGAVSGATGYHVYRGATRLTAAAGTTATSFDDTSAATALTSSWQAPSGLGTTNGPDNVALAWTAPTRPTGTDLAYTVTALNPAGESTASAPATGRRVGAALTGYEVSIDGGAWTDVGGTGTGWTDTTAPAGSVGITSVTASDETYAEFVRLTSSVTSADGTARNYRVRATLADNTTTSASTAATGRRVVGQPTLQWERATAQTGPFSGLSGATSATFDDMTAPSEGSIRYYRLRANATGASEVVSAVVSGARLPAPEAPTNVTATTTRTDAIVISWDGVDRASGYHVFRGATRLTDFPTTETAYTDDSAATEPPAWDGISGLDATGSLEGVTLAWTLPTRPSRTHAYTVRSVNAAGQSGLSSEASGTRLAPALTAIEVGVRRSPTAAETTVSLQPTDSTWFDAQADKATPLYENASASLSLYTDAVSLTLDNPTITPAATHEYRVRIVASSALDWSTGASERRATPETMNIQWQRDDGDGYFDLIGVTGTQAADTSAEKDGTTHNYRAALSGVALNTKHTQESLEGSLLAIVDVAVGESHSCALDAAGQIWCWGFNKYGSLGLGYESTEEFISPLRASVAAPNAMLAIYSGPTSRSMCAAGTPTKTACWGPIASLYAASPARLPGDHLVSAMRLGKGLFGCMISDNSHALCFGEQYDGELGDNVGQSTELEPTNSKILAGIPPQPTDLVGTSLAMGGNHGCAVVPGGGGACWGDNGSGQLGSTVAGTATWLANPVRTNANTALSGVNAISAGAAHSCARFVSQSQSLITCWGLNTEGQLGDSTTTTRSFANAVVVGFENETPTELESGASFSCVKTAEVPDALYCWGSNKYGQLMRATVDTFDATASPGSGVGEIESFSLGSTHGCLVTANRVLCWGNNKNGILGLGLTAVELPHSSTPKKVAFPTLMQP